METSIGISFKLKKKLVELKQYPNETYEETINNLIKQKVKGSWDNGMV